MLIPDTVENRFFAPLSSAIPSERSGQRFSDGEFVRAGILRVAAQSISGRDFLQLSHGIHDLPIASSTYFDATGSSKKTVGENWGISRESGVWVYVGREASNPDLLTIF